MARTDEDSFSETINIVRLEVVCQGKREYYIWGYSSGIFKNQQSSVMSVNACVIRISLIFYTSAVSQNYLE